MTTKWMHNLIFLGAFVISVVSLFIVIMYFRHDRYWTPHRFGGLPVALACIPIGVVSYGVGAYYANKWLRPRLFPRLRKLFPAPPTD